MPVSTGLKVQPSRFAAIALDSDSDSEKESAWYQVPQGKNKSGAKGARGPGGGGGRGSGGKQAALPGGAAGDESKGLSKSAKKRARKKRNQSSSAESAEGGGAQGGEKGDGCLEHWREKNAEAADKDFQKDLEEAILLSTLEAEQQTKLRTRSAASPPPPLQVPKEGRGTQAVASKGTKSKKGVTMSLQELHRTTPISPPPLETQDVWSPPSEARGDSPMVSAPLGQDAMFFSRLVQEVQSERRKEETRERRMEEPPQSPVEESARVAHLMDEQEKRDKAIANLKTDNEKLKTALKEVKERNRSLCKILSRGEFSSKAQLLQQIDELSSVKNELTAEIESLHSSLEQERSKNKTLKLEVTRLQGLTAAAKGTTGAKK